MMTAGVSSTAKIAFTGAGVSWLFLKPFKFVPIRILGTACVCAVGIFFYNETSRLPAPEGNRIGFVFLSIANHFPSAKSSVFE